jgi:hypothetical protein
MRKKIDWFNGKNALNDYDMQEICNQIANVDTPENLVEVIKGSNQIVVDVAEDNKSLEIHLDAETTADISRSLKTPVSAPPTTKLVAVDTTNSQEMLTLGTGLSIENGTLNANGEKLYKHTLYANAKTLDNQNLNNIFIVIELYNNSNSLLNKDTLLANIPRYITFMPVSIYDGSVNKKLISNSFLNTITDNLNLSYNALENGNISYFTQDILFTMVIDTVTEV